MTVLVAYKPSELGDAVLEAAIEEARVRGDSLLLVRHVRTDRSRTGSLIMADADGGASAPKGDTGQSIVKLREEMEELASEIALRGVECEAVLLDEGVDAASEILDLARRSDVGTIVLGITRRSRVGKAVLGSEAQDILLNAPCPVLAVPKAT